MAKHPGPDKINEAIVLRKLGYGMATISERVGVPVRTLNDHMRRHKVRKGSVSAEALEAARHELTRAILAPAEIQAAVAAQLVDDLTLCRAIRDKAATLIESIEAGTLNDVAKAARSLAAVSTAIKNASDLARHSLGQHDSNDPEDLPVLRVERLTNEQIDSMRQAQQQADDVDLGE